MAGAIPPSLRRQLAVGAAKWVLPPAALVGSLYAVGRYNFTETIPDAIKQGLPVVNIDGGDSYVAIKAVRNPDNSYRTDAEGHVMVEVYDPKTEQPTKISTELRSSPYTPKEMEALEKEWKTHSNNFISKHAEIMKSSGWRKSAAGLREIFVDYYKGASAVGVREQQEEIAGKDPGLKQPDTKGGKQTGAWETIKKFLPYAGPALGLGIAAMGNFSIMSIVLGSAVGLGGIFADKIESGIKGERDKIDAADAAAKKAAGNGGPGAEKKVERVEEVQPTAREVASSLDIPDSVRLPVSNADNVQTVPVSSAAPMQPQQGGASIPPQ